MFSPRILTVFAAVAAAAAWPASEKPQYPNPITQLGSADFFGNDDPWYSFIGHIFAPLFSSFPKWMSQSGPKVIEDNDKFQIEMTLKNFNKDDITVKVKGCFLYIQATHESKKGEHDISSNTIFQTYSMPANSSGKDAIAEFSSDGTLTVTVPKKGTAEDEEFERQVPIQETGKPYVTPENSPALETSTLPEDDRKEPTTPGNDFENSADNDNRIPHGNDAKL